MKTRPRLTSACRAKALEAGLYQQHDGTFVGVRQMVDAHLVNALLKALLDGEPATITGPLAAEVKRRKLERYAEGIVTERMGKGGV